MSRRILASHRPLFGTSPSSGSASMLAPRRCAGRAQLPDHGAAARTAQRAAADRRRRCPSCCRTRPTSTPSSRRDTLWGISGLYLKSPWRWPELWGMNLEQVRNPHLIFPGQVLFLDKTNGAARLRMGAAGRRRRRCRAVAADPLQATSRLDGIASIPFHLIEPFLNEAVIFETNELASRAAHRRDAGRPRAAVARRHRLRARRPRPATASSASSASRGRCKDPTTNEMLGYEATYVGASEYTVAGRDPRPTPTGKAEIIPATFTMTSIRQEAGVGDRLAPVPAREYTNYAPHAAGRRRWPGRSSRSTATR